MRRSTRRPTPRATRTAAGLLALPLSLVVLTGCWLPDVSMSTDPRGAAPATSAAATETSGAAETEEPAASSTPTRPSGELDAGSVTHQQPAGDRTLVIDYWTTQQATGWTPSSTKTIQLSAHLEGQEQTAASITVDVTRFAAVLDDGSTRTTVVEDRGQFALQPPFTYGTAIELPASDPAVDSVTVTVQFDLLVETGKNTDSFYRQTVIDTLVLPLVTQEGTQ